MRVDVHVPVLLLVPRAVAVAGMHGFVWRQGKSRWLSRRRRMGSQKGVVVLVALVEAGRAGVVKMMVVIMWEMLAGVWIVKWV